MPKLKIDWDKARETFLTDKMITLQEVAQEYGISYSRMRKVARYQRWTIKKKEFWKQADEKAWKKLEQIIIKKAVNRVKTQFNGQVSE